MMERQTFDKYTVASGNTLASANIINDAQATTAKTKLVAYMAAFYLLANKGIAIPESRNPEVDSDDDDYAFFTD